MLAFGSLRCQGASQGGALCVKRCKESAQIWTKCPPSALRVQRPQLPPCIPMPQIPSSEQEQPFKSTRQTTSNDTKLQEVSRSECFLNIYIYIYVKSNQLHGPTMSRSSDKKYAPAWMTCGRLSFSASAKATMAGAISPWHSVASSQRLQRTRR